MVVEESSLKYLGERKNHQKKTNVFYLTFVGRIMENKFIREGGS